VTRGSDINTIQRVRAVCTSRTILELGARMAWHAPVGRPPVQPAYVLLAFGALTRLARSGIRTEYDLADRHVWSYARGLLAETARASGLNLPPPGKAPPKWDHWRHARDHHLATEDGLALWAREFPAVAADLAKDVGLCRTDRTGSFTHPDPEQCIYGDGTLVRPIYAPPVATTLTRDDGTRYTAYPDPRTGELHEQPPHRFDPDLQPHHGRLGPVLTHGYVAWHARGRAPYQRVVLAVDHIPAPGQEAATAVELARAIHRHLGNGVKAAIYDGAMHGTHIEHIMRTYGWLVLAKTPASSLAAAETPTGLVVNRAGKATRSYPLAPVTHDTPAGSCVHQLAAINGQVVDLGLDDAGDPVVLAVLERGPVKRSRRSSGRYYFNVGYHLACPRGRFTTWLSPHSTKTGDATRPHNLRIINEDDPDFARLHGLRNDSENFHSNLKRTLLVNRQMSLGWRRGLIDIYCYALLNNALTEQRLREPTPVPRRARGAWT
jgi:hypothetical protein